MSTIGTVCLLVILTATTFANPHQKKIVQLYFPEDDVQVLAAENFRDKIENSTAWFVKFYLSWCGHCRRLSIEWKQLADDIRQWQDLVQVGAVDCAEERNVVVCHEQGITKYPILRYYPFNGTALDVELPEAETAVFMKQALLDRMLVEITEGGGKIYPNLLPFQGDDFSKLFQEAPEGTKYVFLIIEDPEGYLGMDVAMDLHKIPNVVVRRAFNNNTALTNNLPSNKSLVLVAVDSGYNLEVIDEENSTKKDVEESIFKFLKSKGIKIAVKVSKQKKNESIVDKSDDDVRKIVKTMGNVVFQKDLESAVRHSLKLEVAASENITGEKLAALVAYSEVLTKYFPFGYKSPPFLAELKNYTSGAKVKGRKIAEIVKKAEEAEVFSSEFGFLGCLGSSPWFRGYPCSLWQLFHYLTVNADNATDPGEVLTAMQGYVKHFFGCEECSEHFQEMASRRNLSEVGSLDESILWLWRAHNEVNERLKDEYSEDPEFPKEQFPTKQACFECFNEDSSWDEEEVLKYLKTMYGKDNVRYLGSNTLVLFEGLR